MTERQKIAHLYRRFGFGASVAELDAAEKVGFEKALDQLIRYDKVPDDFNVSPWEFVWRDKEEADVGSWRLRCWWVYRMIATKRPLEEKLTLFWHSHFAVGDDKVEFGPMMLDYYQSLRKNAIGKFRNLLGAVAFEPAMMRYLDLDRSLKGRPNENWARELMELFTLGIGHYTEQDVKEVSRAFTGYGYVNTFWEMPGNTDQKVKDALQDGRTFAAATFMPTMRDEQPKTILGKTKNWTADEVLDMLAEHPQTSKFITEKLWAYFAYAEPEPALVEKIAGVFRKSKGDIPQTLMAIAKSPEFWSEKCVRQMPKSPADLVVGIARQQGMAEPLIAARPAGAKSTDRIPQLIIDQCGHVAYRMSRMGLELLIPPDVSGWKWGTAWITPANMAERFNYLGLHIPTADKINTSSVNISAYIKRMAPKDSKEAAQAFASFYDVEMSPGTESALTATFERLGGPKYLENKASWDGVYWHATRLLFAAPEMQMS